MTSTTFRTKSSSPQIRMGRHWLKTAAVTAALLSSGLVATTITAAPAHASESDGIAWMYDVDHTGGVDPSVFDHTGPSGVPDGYLDGNHVVLPTPDGLRLAWLYDYNQDSLTEVYEVDGNNDGRGDLKLYDPNQDTVMDTYWADPAVYSPVKIVNRGSGGLVVNLGGQGPLGTDPNDVIGTVTVNLDTDPCAPFTWTLPDNMKCTS